VSGSGKGDPVDADRFDPERAKYLGEIDAQCRRVLTHGNIEPDRPPGLCPTRKRLWPLTSEGISLVAVFEVVDGNEEGSDRKGEGIPRLVIDGRLYLQ